MSEIINGTNGGQHVADGPLTTSLTEEIAPGLLLNDIDRRVVKIRPAATPIDQISRLAGARKATSMTVGYYSVDTKPSDTDVYQFSAKQANQGIYNVLVSEGAIFEKSSTVLFPEISTTNGPAVGYVMERDGDTLTVKIVNHAGFVMPPDGSGGKVIRMGRAASELDVQTPQFEALPQKETNYCQIFKAQIEQSTAQRLTNKEVGWSLSDQEEVAIIDMRMGMERNFLFGHKAVVTIPGGGEDVLLTGGIWNQTANTLHYDASQKADADFIVDLTRKAFEGSAGSRRKVLVAGSDLIDRLNRLDITRTAGAAETVTKWGIDFSEVVSKFGRLYVVHSRVFDSCGCAGNGMVIDPEYLTKYSFIPLNAERLDLKSSGQRNTDAVVITEASCLVLRYPQAHLRIIADKAA